MGAGGALAALSAGLIAASFHIPPPVSIAFLPCAAALLWFAAGGRWPRIALLAWLLFFFLAGISLYHLRLRPPDDPSHISAFAGAEVRRLEGRVLDMSRRSDGRHTADLAVGRVFAGQKALAVHGRVRLYLEAGEVDFASGQTVRFRTRLRRPRLFGTPGEFDYVRYLAARDIFVTGHIESPAGVVPVLPVRRAGSTLRIERQRERIGALIDEALPGPSASLVRALIIGDKRQLSPQTRDLLARSGLSHLFSVSGLHLGTTAGFLYLLLALGYRRCERLLLWQPPKRMVPLVLLAPLWGYVQLTGAALPTQRAFIILAVAALLLLVSRPVRPRRVLACAAVVLLAIEPLSLFEPSFQLSFAGVAGIMAVFSGRARHAGGAGAIRAFFFKVFLSTAAATLATLPLVLWHFHLLAPAGLVTNLFAVPLVAFAALPVALFGLLLSFLWPGAAAFFFQVCGALLQGGLSLAQWVVDSPLLQGEPVYVSAWQVLGIALLVATAMALLALPARRRLAAVPGALGVALLAGGALTPGPAAAVTIFSVGQGDSCLVSLAEGRHILVDGGGLHGDRFDVGERLLLPALARLGVKRLEAVVLTHDHPDHRKGLLAVLRGFAVDTFITGSEPSGLDPELVRVLAETGVPVRTLRPGWHPYPCAPGEELRFFVPSRSLPKENDRSVVLFYRYGNQGVLLPGDLEAAGVRHFIDRSPALPVTVLKLPHHGSRFSRSERLLDLFRPKVVAVSAGYKNPHRLPSTQLLGEVGRRGIALYRTDLHGTLRVELAADRLAVKHWEKGLFR